MPAAAGRGRIDAMVNWSRGVVLAVGVWGALLVIGLVLLSRGNESAALVTVTVGFFLAPLFMLLGSRLR
ncbi:MAG TPA: hypothetical protein VMU66_06535 [Gaiellales bacterium]|nr:hypothetical protein [Gaiellales bacterium]